MEKIQIEQIRFELTWRIRHQVMYPDLPFDSIKLENDADGIHFGLYAQDQLTAVVSLFNIDQIYQFRKFATIVSAQGKGYGSMLLKYIIDYVKNIGAEKLWCNARVSATGFYSKLGFIQTDQRSVSNGIDFVIMELQLNN
ncbi:GNAT family N-acetyltransferase [Pedobacter nyackensis]|uniref:GNAT family N-acetyltransferase n=1 Tax=Pedobacter nyackensis TaxID=475255 RepID=UPI00292D81D1|nr:GNAT family N-acetyltransferase [Pedobacter nyackensis]